MVELGVAQLGCAQHCSEETSQGTPLRHAPNAGFFGAMRKCIWLVQNAVLGNTAFVVGIEVVTRTDSVDILVTTRNNATFDRTPSQFWPGNTQVFVELLMLEDDEASGAAAAVPLADPGTVEFIHDVWPKKVAYEAFANVSGALPSLFCVCTLRPS